MIKNIQQKQQQQQQQVQQQQLQQRQQILCQFNLISDFSDELQMKYIAKMKDQKNLNSRPKKNRFFFELFFDILGVAKRRVWLEF